MLTRYCFLLAALLIVITLCRCGTPGAPQPPSLQLARPVDDLTASRKGSQVELNWTLQQKNMDRTLVKNIPEVRVCRQLGAVLMSSCAVVADVSAPKQKPVKKKDQGEQPKIKMHYVDTLPLDLEREEPTGVVTYAVEEMNVHGRSAGLSNQVQIPIAPTIPAPDTVTASLSADGVRISWEAVPATNPPRGLTYLYQVERRAAGAPGYVGVAQVDPSAGFYLDKTFEWETNYQYRLTAVTQVHEQGANVEVEGDDSKPVDIFTRDIYPPAQPVGLQAVFSSVGQKPFIDLTWAPNLESELAGYNVFRRTPEGSWEKLNSPLISGPAFRDEKVQPGKTYIYSVSAVDLRGNESPRSAEASETAAENTR